MKFVLPADGIRQFGTVGIVISDKQLAQILPFITDSSAERWAGVIALSKKDSGTFMCFRSGAKLGYAECNKRFYIYGYHYSGLDIRAAMEQLKMAEALYKAAQHGSKMLSIMDAHRPQPTMKVTWDYDNMRRAA